LSWQKSFEDWGVVRVAKSGKSDAASGQGKESDPPRVKPTQMPDASVIEHTGRSREEWFALLDAFGARNKTHTEMARFLVEEHNLTMWWGGNISIEYQQFHGMRQPGQSLDGSFAISGNKTVDVSVDRLFEAFANADLREQWLGDAKLSVRTATAPKTWRADWDGGASKVGATFTAKGDGKSSVNVYHERLLDADQAAHQKVYWKDRLAEMKKLLEG
jgi:uncharacterized protein YndB with AHSA1/START domain